MESKKGQQGFNSWVFLVFGLIIAILLFAIIVYQMRTKIFGL